MKPEEIKTKRLMPEGSNEDNFEEIWSVVLSNGGKYELSKNQALIVKQAIMSKKKVVMFNTFAIAIPYIVEFYRERRFLRGAKQLPSRATERPFKPIDPKRWTRIKEEIYKKIGKR